MSRTPSCAAEPSPGMVEQVVALWRSGHVKPLVPLATPWLFDASAAQPLEQTLRVLHAAVEQTLRWWAEGAPFLPPIAFDARVADAARLDARAGRLLGFVRFDVVCPADAPEAFQLLEVQAGDPSAMGWHDALGAAMREGLPADAAPLWMMPSHYEVFARHVGLEGRSTSRALAFVVKKDSVVESDHRLLAAYYRSRGWEARVVEPRALRFEDGRLLAEGLEVGAVFRDALDELFAGDGSGGLALLAAHRAGLPVMNSFLSAVADDKSLLEVLSSPERWAPRVAEVLAAHVPWTRCLSERRVSFEGRDEDLVPLVRRRRDLMVLKPVDGYGGFGVVVGPHVEPAGWERAVEAALTGERRFVVQRHVPLPVQRVFPLAEDGTCLATERNVVHSFWMHEQRFAGGFMRASAHPVVNVHQGGGLAPVFFHPPLQ